MRFRASVNLSVENENVLLLQRFQPGKHTIIYIYIYIYIYIPAIFKIHPDL